MRMKDLAVTVRDLFYLDPRIIQEEPGWNVREPTKELTDHIQSLAHSICEIGVQEPLTVIMRDDIPIVRNGHCRLMAVRMAIAEGADIKSVPVRVEDRYSSDADQTLLMVIRNNGKALTPLETSKVFKKLEFFGWTPTDIAKKTGYSLSYVCNLLNFSAMPSEIHQMVRDGAVSATLASETVRRKGTAEGTKTLKEAKEKKEGRITKKDLPADKALQQSLFMDWNKWGYEIYCTLRDVVADNEAWPAALDPLRVKISKLIADIEQCLKETKA